MNRDAFLIAYRKALVEYYDWARNNEEKLERFMHSVRATLDGANTWNHGGVCVVVAWRAVGGKGTPTLKALRSLPS